MENRRKSWFNSIFFSCDKLFYPLKNKGSFYLSSANAFVLDRFKILSSVNRKTNEQFLLFLIVFSTYFNKFSPVSSNLNLMSANSFTLDESKICCFERVNPFPHNDTFWCPWETSLLKTLWEKGEIARNEQFLLFPQCFLPILITIYFCQIWNCRLQTLSVWKRLNFVVW